MALPARQRHFLLRSTRSREGWQPLPRARSGKVEPGFPPGSRDQRKNRERPRRRDGSDDVETAL